MYNFADGNTLSALAKTAVELTDNLQAETEDVINFFKKNKMIVNADKFQTIILDKQKLTIELRLLNLIIKQLRLYLLPDTLVFN